ncbi:MAG: hypothetical protein OXC11_12075, partial [Rhodospirillales bacterium]|nr:hypothetical protein [Rhodospirillales bacterium]
MLADYGKLYVSSAKYAELRPDSVDAAIREWRAAAPEGAVLGGRGGGPGRSGGRLAPAGAAPERARGARP